MSGIRRPYIDKSRIKDKDFWTIEPVVRAETWLQDELMKPGYFDKLCVHEGAHLYYIRQIYPEAKILAPAVYYHPAKQKFLPLEAAIDFRGMNKTCDYARKALRRMRRRPTLVTAFWEQAELFPL